MPADLIARRIGGQPWHDATVFDSVVLGLGGAKFYNEARVKLDPAALSSPTMEKSCDTLAKIKTYIDKDASGRDWNLATAMVMNGKGGLQFMGDWAKGEFTAANKISGKDYTCVAAPGTANSHTFNIDSFAMFNVNVADANEGQLDLVTAIISPEFQEVFNLNKGSIPVRPGVNNAKFDACATKSMADFDSTAKTGDLVASFAHGMATLSAKQGAIVDVIVRFMNSTSSSKDAVAALVKGASKNSFFGDAVLGARSAATRADALVRELICQKREHRATTQCAPQMNF